MEVLYWLESLRTPIMDTIMAALTHFGEEMLFMVIAMIVMWCVNKYEGYYLLIVCFLGTQLNQLLKATFRIERPWIRDEQFKPVEAAIPEATGYSFPSGHTQCAVGLYGGLARWNRAVWLRVAAVALCVIVPFSRMYLGVHTPLDVGVSIAVALVLVLGIYPLIQKAVTTKNGIRYILLVMVAISIAQVIYLTVALHGETEERLLHALDTSRKMCGASVGFWIAHECDKAFLHFDTNAVWWAQILKVLLGLVLTLGTKELAYLLFDPLGKPASQFLTYMVMVLFAGVVWPLTFRWFARFGKKAA